MSRQEIILEYIWANFWLRYSPVDFKIDIGYNGIEKINVRNCGYQFNQNDKRISEKEFIFAEWNGTRLPFLSNEIPKEIITFNEGTCTINVDIISSVFYFLSGWQELYAEKRDEFDRFTFKGSIQDELNIVSLPVVNYYFEILKTAIEYTYNTELNLRKKNGSFYVIISHDIDELDTLWLQEGFHALKKGRFYALPLLAFNKVTGNDVSKSIRSVIKANEHWKSNAIKSTFFFLCRNEREGIYKNADYDINDDKIKKVITSVIDSGNEIGIHGSFHTHNSSENLRKDIEVIESITTGKIKGNRFHFLSYGKETPSVLEKNGINFDSTLGFAETIGFRNSYADPFYLFDHDKFAATSVVEFPLSLMDASLYFKQYMNYGYKESADAVIDFVDNVSRVNGTLVVNWHNTGYLQYKNSWLSEVLKHIISESIADDAKFVTMGEYYNELKS